MTLGIGRASVVSVIVIIQRFFVNFNGQRSRLYEVQCQSTETPVTSKVISEYLKYVRSQSPATSGEVLGIAGSALFLLTTVTIEAARTVDSRRSKLTLRAFQLAQLHPVGYWHRAWSW